MLFIIFLVFLFGLLQPYWKSPNLLASTILHAIAIFVGREAHLFKLPVETLLQCVIVCGVEQARGCWAIIFYSNPHAWWKNMSHNSRVDFPTLGFPCSSCVSTIVVRFFPFPRISHPGFPVSIHNPSSYPHSFPSILIVSHIFSFPIYTTTLSLILFPFSIRVSFTF